MANYSKFNIVYKIQKWMESVAGQTFLNYAYSWGASVVILGTLFKLTHLPGANFFLFLGMGTEVFVFFISAFDRPFDKTTDGMDLEVHSLENNPRVVQGDSAETAPATDRPARHHYTSGDDIEIFDVVDEEQISNARERMLLMEHLEKMRNRADKEMEMLKQMSENLPNSEEAAELKKTLDDLHEVYKRLLTKASEQVATTQNINMQLEQLSMNLDELNRVYARMVVAIRQR